MAEGPAWWRGPFLRLWAGQTISLAGSRITLVALPLSAILTLRAGPFQTGLLTAAETAPALVIGLLAGVWVDRIRRRPLMIGMDLARAVLLFSIPVAAWLGVLSLGQLYVVAFGAAALTIVFSLAYTSYVPSLVPKSRLVDANSRLELSSSLAQILGPALGGGLVQALTAPVAIGADALSFLGSAASLLAIRASEPSVDRAGRESLWHEARSGLDLVARSPVLRSLAAASATFNLFDNVLFGVYVLYMVRTLHLSTPAIGLVFGLGGAGGVLGALLVSPLTRLVGMGRGIMLGLILATAGEMLIAGASGPQVVAVVILVAAEGSVELGATLYSINSLSLRQAQTPPDLQGRVGAAMRLAEWVFGPAGALAGGVLGGAIGLRPTVLVAGVGTLLSLGWLVASPVSRIREEAMTPAT